MVKQVLDRKTNISKSKIKTCFCEGGNVRVLNVDIDKLGITEILK